MRGNVGLHNQKKMDAPPQWNVCMTSLYQGAGVRSQTDRYACMKGYDIVKDLGNLGELLHEGDCSFMLSENSQD